MRSIYQIFLVSILGLLLTNCFSQHIKKDIPFDWKNGEYEAHLATGNDFQLFTPDNEEILLSKNLSTHHIDSLTQINKNQLLRFQNNKYYRQYVGYIDNNGDKIVLINAFCSFKGSLDELKKKWIFVLDGGSCYFNIKINLTKKTCFDFYINGEA